jgi:hypothetical protein
MFLRGVRPIFAGIALSVFGLGLLSPASSADPKYKIQDLKFEVSRGNLVVREKKSGRALRSFPTRKVEAPALYHWGGAATVEWWMREGKVPPESIQYLLDQGGGATGGGLYVTREGPKDTEVFGERLVILEPQEELVVLRNQDNRRLGSLLHQLTGDRSYLDKSEVNRLLAKGSGVDGVLNENGKWISLHNSKAKLKARDATLADFEKFAGGPLNEESPRNLQRLLRFDDAKYLRYIPREDFPLFYVLTGRRKPSAQEQEVIRKWANQNDTIRSVASKRFPQIFADQNAANLSSAFHSGDLVRVGELIRGMGPKQIQCVGAALKNMHSGAGVK